MRVKGTRYKAQGTRHKIMKTEKTIKIRMAVSSEAAAIAALLYQAFAEYKPLFTEKGFEDSTPVQKEIEDRIAEKAVWVAVFDNDIAGTVSILPCSEGLFIRSMAVSPGARGK